MNDSQDDLGQVAHAHGRRSATITRRFDHPPERLWACLTASDMLPLWLAPGELEPRKGGRARLDFADSGTVIDSEVLLWEPQHAVTYSWSGPGEPERPVAWRLDPDESGYRLTLELSVPEDEDAARAFAGWIAHLDMLAATLEGVSIKFPFERFKTAREAYKALLA